MTQPDNKNARKGKRWKGKCEQTSYLKDTEKAKHWEMKARWEELDGHAGEGPTVLNSSH